MIRGKEVIAKVKVGNIIVNFDDLLIARGEKQTEYFLEMRAANVFAFISVILFFVPIVITILAGSFGLDKFLFVSF